jgi:nucleoside-diphosphate-sugar epimerase
MDILLLGGTRFIGRALWQRLLRRGHRVTILHRGNHPLTMAPADIEEVSWDRARFPEIPLALRGRIFDIAIDTCANEPGEVSRFIAASLARRLVVLSSIDVYRAFATVLADQAPIDPVPLAEDAPIRSTRFPFKGLVPGKDNYEKIDCEMEALSSNKIEPVVLRLPFVYGPYDYQCREWFFLRRFLRNKPVVLGGCGAWLGTRIYVEEVAAAVELCATHPKAVGEIYLLGETSTPTLYQMAYQIAEAASLPGEVIEIPDAFLPQHLANYITRPQHLLVSSEKIRQDLGYREQKSAREYLQETVRWHMAQPPYQPEDKRNEEEAAEAEAIQAAKDFLNRPL